MKEKIPRTAYNVYERGDSSMWLLTPRKKRPHIFLDVNKRLLSQNEEGKEELVSKSIDKIIEEIQTMPLGDKKVKTLRNQNNHRS